jgi:sulfur carrier protein
MMGGQEDLMRLTINGAPRDYGGSPRLESLLKDLSIAADRPGVAVAVNDTVIPRGDIPDTPLKDGDRIEVIEAVQGG